MYLAVPDLAFSELAFLNTSRQKATEMAESSNKAQRRKGKKLLNAVDTEAEISHFFSMKKTKPAGDVQALGDRQYPIDRQQQAHDGGRDSTASIVDLPAKPFLGFGTTGSQSVSFVDITKELEDKYPCPTSQTHIRSPTRSTNYLTWSTSVEPSTSKQDARKIRQRDRVSRNPLPGEMIDSDRVETSPRAADKAANPTATLSSQPSIKQGALANIQLTLDALLRACETNPSKAPAEEADIEFAPEPGDVVDEIAKEPPRIGRVPSNTSIKPLGPQQPDFGKWPSIPPQKADCQLQHDVGHFRRSDERDPLLPEQPSEQYRETNTLYCRPHTAGLTYHQDLHTQRPNSVPTGILEGASTSCDRYWEGEIRPDPGYRDYAINKDYSDRHDYGSPSAHDLGWGTADLRLSYTYPPINQSLAIGDLEEGLFADTAPEPSEQYDVQSETIEHLDQTLHGNATAVPVDDGPVTQFKMLRRSIPYVSQNVKLHAVDFSRSNGIGTDPNDGRPVKWSDSSMRGRHSGMVQAQPISRFEEDDAIQPLDFWKPNRWC